MDEETDPVTEDGEVVIYEPRRKTQVFWYEFTTFLPPNYHVEPKYFF